MSQFVHRDVFSGRRRVISSWHHRTGGEEKDEQLTETSDSWAGFTAAGKTLFNICFDVFQSLCLLWHQQVVNLWYLELQRLVDRKQLICNYFDYQVLFCCFLSKNDVKHLMFQCLSVNICCFHRKVNISVCRAVGRTKHALTSLCFRMLWWTFFTVRWCFTNQMNRESADELLMMWAATLQSDSNIVVNAEEITELLHRNMFFHYKQQDPDSKT